MEKYWQNNFYILLFGIQSEGGILRHLILNERCRSNTLYSGFSGHITDLMIPSIFQKNEAQPENLVFRGELYVCLRYDTILL